MTEDGTPFYHNNITKQSQWDKPIQPETTTKPIPPTKVVVINEELETERKEEMNEDLKPNSLPNGWTAMRSNDERIYYQNNITKQTQWNKPEIVQQNVVSGMGGGGGLQQQQPQQQPQ
eukprot:162635_1